MDFGTKNVLSIVISQSRPACSQRTVSLSLPLSIATSVDDLMEEELRLNAGCAGLDVLPGYNICQYTLLITK